MRTMPVSTSIVVVTRKKISSRNAMSAIEPALISDSSRFLRAMPGDYLKSLDTSEYTVATTEMRARM